MRTEELATRNAQHSRRRASWQKRNSKRSRSAETRPSERLRLRENSGISRRGKCERRKPKLPRSFSNKEGSRKPLSDAPRARMTFASPEPEPRTIRACGASTHKATVDALQTQRMGRRTKSLNPTTVAPARRRLRHPQNSPTRIRVSPSTNATQARVPQAAVRSLAATAKVP